MRHPNLRSATILVISAATVLPAACADSFTVYVGYADNLRASGFFPTPWIGSTFNGHTVISQSSVSQTFDSGAIRIDNTGSNPIAISNFKVSTNNGSNLFAIWGSGTQLTIAPGQTGIFTQTTSYNFDSSDQGLFGSFPPANLQPNNADQNGNTNLIGGCSSSPRFFTAAQASGPCAPINAPVISFIENGNAVSLIDSGFVLNTGQWDFLNNNLYGEDGNESINWNPLGGTSRGGGTTTCPAQPLATLAGTWAFSTDGFTTPTFQFLGSGGRFTTSVGMDTNGNSIGLLNVTQTTGINGSISRLETDTGRYQVNDDCTGGTLTFFTGSRPVQFDFFFINTGEIVMVGSNKGDVVTGTARLGTAAACPVDPLAAIAGTWVFSVEGFEIVRVFPELAAAGRFTAAGNVLSVIQTAGISGGNVRLEGDRGTVQVTEDCSGGSLSFAIGGHPIQFDFYFADTNRIILVGTFGGDVIIGDARRFGTA